MSKNLKQMILGSGFMLMSASACSTVINGVLNQLTTVNWQLDLTVVNDTLGADLEGFNLYFDYLSYDNLALVAGHPANWDPLIFPVAPGISADGQYDALADPGPGIPATSQLGLFSLTFDYFGSGTPQSMPFEIYDSSTFAVLDSGVVGFTEVNSLPPEVALPPVLPLLGLGLAGFLASRQK